MSTAQAAQSTGIVCPKCGCGRLPARFTRRVGSRMMRVRACKKCGARVRTVERVHGSA